MLLLWLVFLCGSVHSPCPGLYRLPHGKGSYKIRKMLMSDLENCLSVDGGGTRSLYAGVQKLYWNPIEANSFSCQ